MTTQAMRKSMPSGVWLAGAIIALLAWDAVAFSAPPEPARERPMVPLDAATIAARDLEALSAEVAEQRRYIWCPTASKEEQAAATLLVNFAVSRSNVDVVPKPIAGGKLMAVDLRLCAPEEAEFERLLSLWASLSDEEPYFHVRANVLVKVDPYVHSDGKTYTAKRKQVGIAAPHLGEVGVKLESLVGNPLPAEQSFCPIIRLGWAIGELLGTADGARYYDFRGIDESVTLEKYLVSRGASREQAKRLDADERAAMISRVTGKARAITMFQGQGTRPSVGAAIVAVTDDLFDNQDDAQKDPFRELLDAKTDGHEVLVTLPSGWIEYSIWQGDGTLALEAPPNLVADHRIPEPFTRRLHGALSCIRCHAANDQWMPFANEVALMLGGRLGVLGDANSPLGASETLRRLAGLYSGDLSHVVEQAQDNFERRVFAATGMSAAAAAQALSAIHARYEYEYVTAAAACWELGFALDAGDELGTKTFDRIVPGQTPEDPILGRYRIDYLNPATGKRAGLKNTRKQWELVWADAMARALPALIEARKAE